MRRRAKGGPADLSFPARGAKVTKDSLSLFWCASVLPEDISLLVTKSRYTPNTRYRNAFRVRSVNLFGYEGRSLVTACVESKVSMRACTTTPYCSICWRCEV